MSIPAYLARAVAVRLLLASCGFVSPAFGAPPSPVTAAAPAASIAGQAP